MQTLPHPNLLATHQPGTRQPERRMARNRRGEAGLILKPKNEEPNLGVHGFWAPECMLIFRAIRGRLGDRVYKTYGEKIITTRVPSFEGYVPSAAQRDRRDRMRAATAFAQAVYADPAAKAVYVAAAKSLGRQPFRLAVSDFLRGRTRISPSAPCMATSPETPGKLAQGSHAANVQRRGSRKLISGPNHKGRSTRAKRKRGRERAPIRCRGRPVSVSAPPATMHALLGLAWAPLGGNPTKMIPLPSGSHKSGPPRWPPLSLRSKPLRFQIQHVRP